MKAIKDMNLAECLETLKYLYEETPPVTFDKGTDMGYFASELADRIHDLTQWVQVSDKDIEQVADDEKQQDWDRLEYREVYRDGFVMGAHWMQARTKRNTP
jgi:hypothetical protein